MNIIRETKWTLLEIFPEQKETEADAEIAAWNKVFTDEAEAIAKEKAEAEAKAKKAAEKEAAKAAEESEKPEVAIDQIEADMASIDLVEKMKTDSPDDEDEPEPHPAYDPEIHNVPVSVVPEGERPNGVLAMDYSARGAHLDVQCSPEQVTELAKALDETGFCLESISGIDWIKEEQMEVVYDYNRTDGQFCRVVVRVRIPRAEPSVPTISDIHPGANWHERETHEFFGIKFEGHPYLVPLLLPEDADFHPLLKDFTP
jgi:NADH-quinone oxidoreductase subunit C